MNSEITNASDHILDCAYFHEEFLGRILDSLMKDQLCEKPEDAIDPIIRLTEEGLLDAFYWEEHLTPIDKVERGI